MHTQHQKVIATGIVCVALLASVLVFNNKNTLFGQKNPAQASLTVDNNVNKAPIETGDWKKSLISVANATDTSVQIVSPQTDTGNTVDNTVTGQISKTFFSLYLADQKNGVAIDDAEATNIANQALNNVNIPSTAKVYSASDIHFITGMSSVQVKAYETAMLNAVLNNVPINSENELGVISKIAQSQNADDIKKLDPYIKDYQAVIHDTLSITVPEPVAGYQVVYLNTVSSIVDDLQKMKHLLDDPVVGYVGFAHYQTDVAKLQIATKRINQILLTEYPQ